MTTRTIGDPGGGRPAPGPGRPIARAYGRGCRRSAVAGVVGGVLGIGMVAWALWLAQAPLGPPTRTRDVILAVAVVLPLVVVWAGVALMVWVMVRRRARRLDPAFASVAPRGRQHGPILRSWRGAFDGRRADAWFGKGPTVELYLSADAGTRLAFGRPGRLGGVARRFGHSPVPAAGLPLAPGVELYTDDEPWARRLLDAPGVARAVETLLEPDGRTLANLAVEPGSVHYLRKFDRFPDLRRPTVDGWLGELGTIAAAVERLGPSAAGETPSGLEEWARHRRGRTLTCALTWILVGGAVAFAGLVALVAWLGIGR